MPYYTNTAGHRFPLPERRLENDDARDADLKEDWKDPSDETLIRFAEENYKEFIQYIIGYDQSLLFDFAVLDNKLDFKEFCGG